MKIYSILTLVLFCFACGDSVQKKKTSNTNNSLINNGTSQTQGTTPTNNNRTTPNNGTTTQTNNRTTTQTNNGTTTQTNNGTTGGTTNPGNKCPVAIAEGREGNLWATTIDVKAATTVDLRSISTDSDGTVEDYQWLIISQPVGSTTRLSGPTTEFPTLFLDLVGTYSVELTVLDNEGKASCTPARVSIRAIAEEDFLVQLTWETPADPDQNDMNGSDLDIHYLHPNGDWNRSPFDIFFNNKTADWGLAGNSDDPELTIDDVNGAGPEVVVHKNPENSATYSIGVYYYADRGFGPSYATVQIFLNGRLASEFKDQYLAQTGVFWQVATVSWPSKQITPINTIRNGFP